MGIVVSDLLKETTNEDPVVIGYDTTTPLITFVE